MPITDNQLDQFYTFAQEVISQQGNELTLDELWDQWRQTQPTPAESREDLLAIKAAIRDMESGDRGTAASDYIRELRKRYDLPNQP